jgi:hypothetical protein
MTPEEAVAAIEAIDEHDPEKAHALLDEILLCCVPSDVAETAVDLMERCAWWACA